MESGKRQIRSTFTPRSNKRLKYDSSLTYTRVYYSSTFDLYNFSDSLLLSRITEKFPNCYLVIGIENSLEPCIMTLQEREESLRLCPSVRQILCPAPVVDYNFLKTFEIDYLCVTPAKSEFYAPLELGEGLVIVDSPMNLTSKDLIARIVNEKDQFLNRCLENGYDRKQLHISLFKEISLKVSSYTRLPDWARKRLNLVELVTSKGRKFLKRIAKRIEAIDSCVKETQTDRNQD